jgi:hypothetical protein
VNPIDWIMQDQDLFEIEYPSIFGQDVAGEVVEVGENSDFRVGQRMIAYAQDFHIYMYQRTLLTAFSTATANRIPNHLEEGFKSIQLSTKIDLRSSHTKSPHLKA